MYERRFEATLPTLLTKQTNEYDHNIKLNDLIEFIKNSCFILNGLS